LIPESENKKDQFNINKKKVVKVDGGDSLQKIYFDDGSSEDLDGLFIANDSASSVDFARSMGIITDGNSIVVDKFQKTNFDGIFAAGDCTGGFKQVSTAVGEGAMAAKKISEYIRETKQVQK
jgi:thioredoxin reductase (NADPH)